MVFRGEGKEVFLLEEIKGSSEHLLSQVGQTSSLTLIWCLDDNTSLQIDGVRIDFAKDQLFFLTEFHRIAIIRLGHAKLISFNRAFYCILDHDKEVGCKGVLFFGASQLPVLTLGASDLGKMGNLIDVIADEMNSSDGLQLEMLQILLKRLLILCTRIYKRQGSYEKIEESNLDLVREFHFLIEKHFRTKHTVAEYAELLNKSPKTIANVFAEVESFTPLALVHNRIMLEARRMLRYTDFTVQEIAFDLGFEDLQTFSRFFKRNEGISPSGYKNLS